MATDGTKTVRDICSDALRKAGILGIGDAAPSEDMAQAVSELNTMLKAWQNKGPNIWAKTAVSVTLTTEAEYALTPRPLNLLSVRYKVGGIETPMEQLTRDEYDSLPNKASTGRPTCYYFHRKTDSATITVWPVLASANGETLQITTEAEAADITSENQVLDVAAEYWDAVIYSLAERLADTVPMPTRNPNLPILAKMKRDDAFGFDREESYFWGSEG